MYCLVYNFFGPVFIPFSPDSGLVHIVGLYRFNEWSNSDNIGVISKDLNCKHLSIK